MKTCKICGKEFQPVKNGHTRLYCFECSPIPEKGSTASNVHHKTQLRRAMKQQAVKLKGGKCSVCGYNKNINALSFHHLDPTQKEFQISNGEIRSWDKYLIELEKCVLVCLNCHAEMHN